MKFVIGSFILVTAVSTFNCQSSGSNGIKPSSMDNLGVDHAMTKAEPVSRENADPKALELLSDDFFWSSTDESAPFGNDDGWDAMLSFLDWRKEHPKDSPVEFIHQLVSGWHYETPRITETKPDSIAAFLSTPLAETGTPDDEQLKKVLEIASSQGKQLTADEVNEVIAQARSGMHHSMLVGMDEAIIATCFAAFMKEGRLDRDLGELTKCAIQRQFLPVVLDGWGSDYVATRRADLTKLAQEIDTILALK